VQKKEQTMAIVNGTNSADSLYGTSGADTINGLGGDDTLKGGGGADRLDGGAGIDTAFYSDSDVGVTVNLSTGRGLGGTAEGDTFVNVENVFGSAFDDFIIGDDSHGNTFTGLGGNDILKGGGGNDMLQGDEGDDTLKGGGGADTLIGGAGIDTANYGDAGHGYTVSLASGVAGTFISWPNDLPAWAVEDHLSGIENVTGTQYQDWLLGNAGVNVFHGGLGLDLLDGGAGADIMYGESGDDQFWVDNAGDFVWEYAGEGKDAVFARASYVLPAGSEIEVLHPDEPFGTANINLTGNEFSQDMWGTSGDNVLDGGGGADTMYGWQGNDTYVIDNAGDVVFENTGQGRDAVKTSISLLNTAPFGDIEIFETTDVAGTTNIDITGTFLDNTISGNNGQNTLAGGAGIDALFGHGGNDLLVGGADADVLDGGAGEDTASYDTSASGVQVSLAAGTGFGGDAQGDLLAGIENVVGSAFGDLLTGDGNANKLFGGAGNDEFFGGNAGDLIDGGAGVNTARYDTSPGAVQISLVTGVGMGADAQGDALINIHNLVGSSFGDVLTGDGNVNRLLGGPGADVLSGGGSNDAFVFSPGQANGDVVTDFFGNGAGAGDTLEFVGYGAGATFTQVDATHWQVNYNGNTQHDVITIQNAAIIDPTDFVFL
jgi:Ca2+-binding RTX toxin-like protein